MRQVQQVSRSSLAALPFSLSFCTLVYLPPLLLHSSSPLSNGNGTEPCWSSSARSELSLLRREFMDCHAVFLRFGPAGAENFSLWPNHFGHSLSSLPQYTTGLWLLLSCIMEQNPASVLSLNASPPPLFALQKPLMICGGCCMAPSCWCTYDRPNCHIVNG